MNTVAEIIEAFGGNAQLARILSVGPSTVSEMKRRESIPVEYWPQICAEAKGLGLPTKLTMERMAVIMADAAMRKKAVRVEAAE